MSDVPVLVLGEPLLEIVSLYDSNYKLYYYYHFRCEIFLPVEDGEYGKEEEDVPPLQQEVVGVESLKGAGGDDAQDHQVEGEPGDQEGSPPAPEPVTGKTDNNNLTD